MSLRMFVTLAALVLPASLMAQDAEPESPWSGKATLGYLATSGNTENSTLNTGCELGYRLNFGEALMKDGICRAVNGLDESRQRG